MTTDRNYTFAVGDIHGCWSSFKHLLNHIKMTASHGTIITLGDYVDRGPDSRKMIEWVLAPPEFGWKKICLKGNHEEMLIDAYRAQRCRTDEEEDKLNHWLENGGIQTKTSWGGEWPSIETIRAIDNLPHKHQDQYRCYAHAGVLDYIPWEMQRDHSLLWMRDKELDIRSRKFWGKHFVHGHTPHSEAETVGNRTNVDSGAVFGRKLTAAMFDDAVPGPPIAFITVPGLKG